MISQMLIIRSLQHRITKVYRSLEQFFLTLDQNNFGNKIPFLVFNQFIYRTTAVECELWNKKCIKISFKIHFLGCPIRHSMSILEKNFERILNAPFYSSSHSINLLNECIKLPITQILSLHSLFAFKTRFWCTYLKFEIFKKVGAMSFESKFLLISSSA